MPNGKLPKKPTGPSFGKGLLVWLIILVIVIVVFNFSNMPTEQVYELNYTQFLSLLDKGSVKSVVMKEYAVYTEVPYADFVKVGGKVKPIFQWGRQVQKPKKVRVKVVVPNDPDLIKILKEKGVQIYVKPPEKPPWYMNFLSNWLPLIILIGLWIFFMRQMQAGSGRAFTFGKSRARLVVDQGKKITFKDVADIEEAKEEVREIIEFLKDPKKFQRLGGKMPKGVLLVGPPGTGKTLLAKAIAGEAGVPFLSISGSEFVEMFVGVGAARVRDLFEQARKHAPCIVFIDEIDAVGRQRGAGIGGGHDEREQTLNQLLVEMDGFDTSEGIVILAATNRPDVLDPALLRPGRFDRRVVIPKPDVKGRLEILKVHTRDKPLGEDVDLEVIAKSTPGFSGADLANIVNEAALIAAKKGKDKIEMEDFEEAKDKVLMGVERRSMLISEEEKKTIAYHEAGHALVAKLIPGTDPVHKVTIIPRGLALGVTQQLPEEDRYIHSKDYLLKLITVLLGGRAAEEVVFNIQTTGAANDLERATEIARKMVCFYGMSEKLGPLSFGKKDELVFLGRDIALNKEYSEKTAQEIDEEVRKIVLACYEEAKYLLSENREVLDAIVEALMEKEVISGQELDEILSRFELKKSRMFNEEGKHAA
ncbi:cell division protease FtsH [Thermosulfidibacter takaii ABI70S6]|uniref:ATP-dependent zinc metalloprotease FtsH n=1 Tax=Thermosulfidibacter takaii (strain DSM 17441 / JCM 13301 / NBRC 103674 / ABI70S6) TaxID=1298851 RepID=A0A0S3QUZ3_THET7|nr:ATP-dependent zinc metalloprotease FtsH [Thermosulfidibacter takaii]BAT72145.1 cell division protease FtsH [Thermosulfidibacter takaii ABI70S6]